MKDGFNKQKWTTTAGVSAASFLEKWLRDKFDESMHSLIDAYPFTKRFLQMFFDSDLNSEIEKNAYLAITDAIISTVEELTKDGSLSKFRDIIVPIVHFVCKRLFLLKLAYHANAGKISKERFCELAAEHLAVETAAFVEKAWNMIPLFLDKGKVILVGVLVYFGMDPALAEQTADKINNFLLFVHPIVKKFITKDNIQNLLNKTIVFTIDASRVLLQYSEKVGNEVVSLYKKIESRLKLWGRMLFRKLGWEIPKNMEEKSNVYENTMDKTRPDTRDTERRSRDTERRSRDTERRSRDTERRSRDTERRSRDSKNRTREKDNEKDLSKM